jgi:hypothetical protein
LFQGWVECGRTNPLQDRTNYSGHLKCPHISKQNGQNKEKREVYLLIVRHEATPHSCKIAFDKETRRRKDNIKMDLWEIHYENVNPTELSQDIVH